MKLAEKIAGRYMKRARVPVGPFSWVFKGKIENGGHKLFLDRNSGWFAIADDSGATPDTTDDGVLWLPLKQTLVLGNKPYVALDLLMSDGSKSRTTISPGGAVNLTRAFPGMELDTTAKPLRMAANKMPQTVNVGYSR